MHVSLYLALGAAVAGAACPGAIAAPVPSTSVPSPSVATRAGVCSGAGANPWTYNFEVSGHSAKVLNDASASYPLDSVVFGDNSPAVLSRALKRRFLNDTHAFVDNSVLYIDWDGEGMLFDAGSGPGQPHNTLDRLSTLYAECFHTRKGSDRGNPQSTIIYCIKNMQSRCRQKLRTCAQHNMCCTGEADTSLGFGMVFEHLEAEAIGRNSIKHVFLTHGHADHIAGLVEDFESLSPAFPAATIYISSIEHQFWTADVVCYLLYPSDCMFQHSSLKPRAFERPAAR